MKMLEKIKSIFFTKKILMNLDERRKFKILKYNKKLQNKIDIDLVDYKIISGRYIIYGNNGIGCEYDTKTDQCILEREYSNGEGNEKGKEYDEKNRLIFKGKYLNGKRSGKGKEYYYNNRASYSIDTSFNNDEDSNEESSDKSYEKSILKFKGEYLKGLKWNSKIYDFKEKTFYDLNNGNRSMKEYDYNEHYIIFEGEYRNDLRWNGNGFDNNNNIVYELKNGIGKLKEYKYGKLIFEGEYINGEKNGKGKEYNIYGKLYFEGEYLNDKRNGKGKEYNYKGILAFEGDYPYN